MKKRIVHYIYGSHHCLNTLTSIQIEKNVFLQNLISQICLVTWLSPICLHELEIAYGMTGHPISIRDFTNTHRYHLKSQIFITNNWRSHKRGL